MEGRCDVVICMGGDLLLVAINQYNYMSCDKPRYSEDSTFSEQQS